MRIARDSVAAGAYRPTTGDLRIDTLKRALAANALTESDLALIAAVLDAEVTRSTLAGRDSRAVRCRRIVAKARNQKDALRRAYDGLPIWAKRGNTPFVA